MIFRTVSQEAAVHTVVRRYPALTTYGSADTSCWSWFGPKTWDGYGLTRVGGESQSHYAHRVMYAADRGEQPPAGMVVDHLCHNDDLSCPGGPTCLHRRCVNPAHLEAVTQKENLRRSRERKALIEALGAEPSLN